MSYTTSQTEPLAQRLVANLPGLDINLARAWIGAESGANNNPLGVTASRGSSAPVGQWIGTNTYLVKYATPQAGIDAAAALLQSPSMSWAYGKTAQAIKTGDATAQANALIASPWNTPGSPYYKRVFTAAGLLKPSTALPQTSTVAPKVTVTPKPTVTPTATTTPVPGGLTLQQWIANVKKRSPNASASAVLATAKKDFDAQQKAYSGGFGGHTPEPVAAPGIGFGGHTPEPVAVATAPKFDLPTLLGLPPDTKVTVSNLFSMRLKIAALVKNGTLTQAQADNINTVLVGLSMTPGSVLDPHAGQLGGTTIDSTGASPTGLPDIGFWANPTRLLYVVGGLMLIVAGGWIMLRNNGNTAPVRVIP